MIALTIASFLKAGLKEFQITIGHTGFFNALCEAAGLDDETESQIRDMICSKNYYAAEDILRGIDCPADVHALFADLSHLNGTSEMLGETRSRLKNIPQAKQAIERLMSLYDVLKIYGYERYVSFDLSFLSRYGYYTGIIFEGYTYGSGEAIAKGGRYDNLLENFGSQAPAVGFVLVVDTMMTAMRRQGIEIPIPEGSTAVIYRSRNTREAIETAQKCRSQGRPAALIRIGDDETTADYTDEIKRFHYTELIDLT